MNYKKLCLDLVYCESEKDVIDLLKNEGYWDDSSVWKYYGDNENNFATIGNQQSRPEAAIVEKIINSVDAVLMSECLRSGVNPESPEAPKSVIDALETYFNIYAGKLSNITPAERRNLAENICLVAAGKKRNPCYLIIDKGEGQTPNKMPDTLLSIGKSNKLRIPFVQGKFNMGGTGVFQFCGRRNLQLVISKRHPEIVEHEPIDETSSKWGFTIVRREDPRHGVRSSSYRYLAPVGNVPTFSAGGLPLLPGDYPNPYANDLEWGTFIKLYEYQMTGLYTALYYDPYYRLSLLMPNIALPVRFYERRKGYAAHTYEITMSGLSVRLEEDKSKNVEKGFPTTSPLTVGGQNLRASIYLFKRGKSKNYTKTEGIIFTVNGQTHAYLTKQFFSREKVRMRYLAESLLVIVDCTKLDGRSKEDLFMNSRDRLRSGELRADLEKSLEDLLKNHPGLREFREKRHNEDTENTLKDSRPLADIIESLLKKSPTLSKLFIEGVRLPNPFKVTGGRSQEEFRGRKFPTYFKLIREFGKGIPKHCPVNIRFRVQYKTDAENDYFNRDSDPGDFTLEVNGEEIRDFSVNLWNGNVTLNVELPELAKPDDLLLFRSGINDVSRIDPISEEFYVLVEEKTEKHPSQPGRRKPPSSDEKGDDVERISYLDLPNLVEVRKDEWGNHDFNRDSALKVIDSGESGNDFLINMDNIHLLTEKKANSRIDNELLDAQYKYGMVLIGIALLKDQKDSANYDQIENNGYDETSVYDKITYLTKVVSPILLPMISGLSELQEGEFEMAYEEA
jgi:hypothetical protein